MKNLIFKFLDSLSVRIDKDEFNFQLESHPDYPSILSLYDTLIFFEIDARCLNIVFEDLSLIPNHFLTIIELGNLSKLAIVEKKDLNINLIEYFENEKFYKIDNLAFNEIWSGIILYVESKTLTSKKQDSLRFVKSIIAVLFISVILVSICLNGLTFLLFTFLMFIGLFLSYQAFLHYLGTPTTFSDSVCNYNNVNSNLTGCEMVISNTKILKDNSTRLNFVNLAIFFFVYQFFSIIIQHFTRSLDTLIFINLSLTFLSIPIILVSLYYQKYIIKSWCSICLMIILVILLEFIVLNFHILRVLGGYNISFIYEILTLKNFLKEVFILLCSLILTYYFINSVQKFKEHRGYLVKRSKLVKSFYVFTNLLNSNKELINEGSSSSFICGSNNNSNCRITLILSPFCTHCEKVANIYYDIVKNNRNVYLKINLFFNEDGASEQAKNVHYYLTYIFLSFGQGEFLKELIEFYKVKSLPLNRYNNYDFRNQENDIDIQDMLKNQYLWNIENEIVFTPSIFVNGREFPKQYEKEDIEYFIKDLVEQD